MMLPAHLQTRWSALQRREQQLVQAALALLLAAGLWWLALAPALATLRSAESQHRLLDAQLQQMQRLQAQASTLQAQPRLALADARRLLQASVQQQFGATAQLALLGERATVTLQGAAPDALAQWLAQVRLNVRLTPHEARLQRSAAGLWNGTLVLLLGAP